VLSPASGSMVRIWVPSLPEIEMSHRSVMTMSRSPSPSASRRNRCSKSVEEVETLPPPRQGGPAYAGAAVRTMPRAATTGHEALAEGLAHGHPRRDVGPSH